jgi:hypothetical protein
MGELQTIQIPDGAWDKAREFASLPAGSYLAVVSKVEDERKNPEVAQIRVELSAILPDGAQKRLCFDTLTFNDKAMGLALQKIEAMGIPRGAKAFHPSELIGRRVRAHTKARTYVNANGETRQGLELDIYRGTHAGLEIVEQPAIGELAPAAAPPDGPVIPF